MDRTRDEITATLRANEQLIFEFTKAYYRSPHTFLSTRVFGHLACKMPTDLWIFHDLFNQYRFQTVIETGTATGGTTLWFAVLMDILKIEHGTVFSIDLAPEPDLPQHPRIVYLTGSSTDPEIVSRVLDHPFGLRAPDGLESHRHGPVLVDLDAAHFAPHVTKELETWAPHVPVGSWIVVEDTNGAPVMTHPQTGQPVQVEGAYAGMMEYLYRHPEEFIHEVVCERLWISMNPRGWLQRVKACEHA
jgi:cephalosporin hydroxylase